MHFTFLCTQPDDGPTELKHIAYMKICSCVKQYSTVYLVNISLFAKCPDLLCGTPNLLFNVNQGSFPRSKVARV